MAIQFLQRSDDTKDRAVPFDDGGAEEGGEGVDGVRVAVAGGAELAGD